FLGIVRRSHVGERVAAEGIPIRVEELLECAKFIASNAIDEGCVSRGEVLGVVVAVVVGLTHHGTSRQELREYRSSAEWKEQGFGCYYYERERLPQERLNGGQLVASSPRDEATAFFFALRDEALSST